MENLLKYIRLVFEERYKEEETPFRCVKERVEKGFGECICIPGIALNYCAIVAKCCYDKQELIHDVKWDDMYKMYLPICSLKDKKLVPNVQDEKERNTCKYALELCGKGVNTFSYIEISKQYTEDIRKEECLRNGIEDFGNAMDYFRLFTLIADGYNHVEKIEVYGERLFRLFLFLFPITALKIIEQNYGEFKENTEFKDYNKKLLENYLILGDGVLEMNIKTYDKIADCLKKVNDFTGFNFYRVYQRYQEERADAAEVLDLLKNQMDLCSKKKRTVKKILKNL